MEGEKDDIQFYFGRAFRALKRAENDMTRKIVETVYKLNVKSYIIDDDIFSTSFVAFRCSQSAYYNFKSKIVKLARPNETLGTSSCPSP